VPPDFSGQSHFRENAAVSGRTIVEPRAPSLQGSRGLRTGAEGALKRAGHGRHYRFIEHIGAFDGKHQQSLKGRVRNGLLASDEKPG
jgi:hypothetical protein